MSLPKKKLKEHEEYIFKTNLINEAAKLRKQLQSSEDQINSLSQTISNRFIKSDAKETELKNYIEHLSSKVYAVSINNETTENIEKLHDEILRMISVIQDKVRAQIQITREEMEREVTEKFTEAEKKQKELMNEKIEEQKKVFDRMNYTKSELEKVRKRFEETNTQCEYLIKKNEKLRVQLSTTTKSNEILEGKLTALQNQYLKVEKDYNEALNGKSLNNTNSDYLLNSYEKEEAKKAIGGIKNYGKPYQNSQFEGAKTNVIRTLRANIKDAKEDYNKAYKSYIKCQKEKTEAKQLIQKCIEDLSIQLNSLNGRSANPNNEVMRLSLERKLKVLTYIYDNGLQNIKNQKGKLILK